MRRTTALTLIFVVVFAIGIPVFAMTVLWARSTDAYRGYTGPEQFVVIPTGSSTSEIGRLLSEAGVVPDRLTFRFAAWWTGQGARLKAGEYRFNRAIAPVAVIDRLAKGDVFTVRVTFPEGLTLAEMATRYESAGLGQAVEFLKAAGDPALRQSLQSILESVERLSAITDNYLRFSRTSSGRRTRFDLGEALGADRFPGTRHERRVARGKCSDQFSHGRPPSAERPWRCARESPR